jgi:hypothetical protein
MYLDIPPIANVLTLADLRQKQIDKRLMITESVIKFSSSVRLIASSKLEPTDKGPYQIVQVHTNGTATVLLQPNTTERYNVRRITPYRQPLPVLP